MTKTRSLPLSAAAAMAVLTGVYLSFEIPFGALLLDVVSSSADADTVSRLEQAGRLIAGAALALAILPFVIKRALRGDLPLSHILRRAAVVSLAIVGIAFFAQRALVDQIAERSTAGERKAAVQALTIRASLPSDLSGDPAGRAMAALSPLASFVRPAALAESGGLRTLTTEQARRAVGSADQLRTGAYAKALGQARTAYDTYRSSQTAISAAAGNARTTSAQAWQKWYKWINERTWGLASREGIRSQTDMASYRRIAREQGVPVSDTWYPLDEAGFRAAVERAYMDKVSAKADAAGIPAGITSFNGFLRHPAVQAKLRAAMGPIATSLTAGTNADDATFHRAAWTPAVEAARDAALLDATAPTADYADGHRLAALGKSAVRAIAVPPIALLLSLLGLTVHIFKFGNYSLILIAAALRGTSFSRAVLGRPALRFAGIAAAIALGATFVHDGGNASTTSAFWRQSSPAIASHFGATAATVATFVIDMQPGTYPVSAHIATLPHFAEFAAWVHGGPTTRTLPTIVASR